MTKLPSAFSMPVTLAAAPTSHQEADYPAHTREPYRGGVGHPLAAEPPRPARLEADLHRPQYTGWGPVRRSGRPSQIPFLEAPHAGRQHGRQPADGPDDVGRRWRSHDQERG